MSYFPCEALRDLAGLGCIIDVSSAFVEAVTFFPLPWHIVLLWFTLGCGLSSLQKLCMLPDNRDEVVWPSHLYSYCSLLGLLDSRRTSVLMSPSIPYLVQLPGWLRPHLLQGRLCLLHSSLWPPSILCESIQVPLPSWNLTWTLCPHSVHSVDLMGTPGELHLV